MHVRDILSTMGDIMMHVGDIMSTVGGGGVCSVPCGKIFCYLSHDIPHGIQITKDGIRSRY